MRYRKLTTTGDYSFGFGQADLYANQPEAVAQVVLTRLKLFAAEWFLDITDGMDWNGKVLGNNTSFLRDAAIKERILDSPGVNSILSYQSAFDGNTRKFNVVVVLDTIYGQFPPQVPDAISTPTTQISNPRITGLVRSSTIGGTAPGIIGSGMPPPASSGLNVVNQPTEGQLQFQTALLFQLDNPADVLDGPNVLG